MDNVDVGADALNLYVVAPARFYHNQEGDATLAGKSCYADIELADTAMRVTARNIDRTVVVYKLVEVARTSPRDQDNMAYNQYDDKIANTKQRLEWYREEIKDYQHRVDWYVNAIKRTEQELAKLEALPKIDPAELESGWRCFSNFLAGVAQAMWCRYTLRRSNGHPGIGKTRASGEMWTIPEILHAYINTNHLPFHTWATTRQLWLDANKYVGNQLVFDFKTNKLEGQYNDKVPVKVGPLTNYYK